MFETLPGTCKGIKRGFRTTNKILKYTKKIIFSQKRSRLFQKLTWVPVKHLVDFCPVPLGMWQLLFPLALPIPIRFYPPNPVCCPFPVYCHEPETNHEPSFVGKYSRVLKRQPATTTTKISSSIVVLVWPGCLINYHVAAVDISWLWQRAEGNWTDLFPKNRGNHLVILYHHPRFVAIIWVVVSFDTLPRDLSYV